MPRLEQLWARAGSFGAAALDLIYPRNCLLCRTPLRATEAGVVCAACVRAAPFIEPPFCGRCALPFAGQPAEVYRCGYCQDREFAFTRAVAACAATGVARELIHRFKYNRETYFATHLEDWIIGAGWRWLDWTQLDLVVPVPLHPRKHRQREFNQAEVLARALARATGKPLGNRLVRRVRDTETQTHLHARERARNLQDAFAPRRGARLDGARVALVDDVFTTGATLDSCARVLRALGAGDVIALTVARGV